MAIFNDVVETIIDTSLDPTSGQIPAGCSAIIVENRDPVNVAYFSVGVATSSRSTIAPGSTKNIAFHATLPICYYDAGTSSQMVISYYNF